MKDLDEVIRSVLVVVPPEYRQLALELRADAKYQAMLKFWYLTRERIIKKAKTTGDMAWIQALVGFDEAMGLVDRLAGEDRRGEQRQREMNLLKAAEV